ncbi:glycine betaine ABC transporter substrate-binding protein [Stutzerimonas kirkiae]|uniref:Glycine/betaine ABC transporter substrate-binding protein n=1 Tax=Stutzerimonas kirkiae TaxID=2211392 RepID=A0A4Q9RFC5_9GAMM|nr:glycine betaine ABC transporter substrate-binding protein [Stutzerimonas kirkiae]TBU99897.1 glycine/betaine ABC transporter substrate-binding protein [Stutzerimonas kirkiae]TBV05603.1 glycine/betaine ABC transporter substrate-binding protein [Stutzerimonas kirkiae]TBV10656.1 glycine/betaine ABC transporter substrate-binding protein [Stutzerimonas kirkiae]TBV17532.1 glycine/betaine ABC transporter substrate-binding protein [Stutzerimonas kirkiae]
MHRLKSIRLGLAALALGMGTAFAADKPSLKIGYVNGWDDSVAATHVAGEILQSRLGYPIELKPVEPAIMWQGVARGDLDATLSAWLPATHGEYHEKLKDRIEVLGPNYVEAKIGLIVPDYVQARSIAELDTYAKDFGGQIVGIDAGAGVMRRTEDAIKAYGLSEIRLLPSSGAGMATALARAEKAGKPIVVTGWIPHWMFAKWNLRFLEDPQKVFGEAEHIDTVINPGLRPKAADAVAFLGKFSWGAADVGEVMLAIHDGAKPAAAAKAWVEKNPEKVNAWLE